MQTIIGNPKQIIPQILKIDDDKVLEVKLYKKTRNNEQNKKYWKLLTLLANKLEMSIEELHFRMLKDYSVRYEALIPADKELRGVEYFEKKSKITKNNNEFCVYHIYTPSHELKTDEFAFLLQGLCNECENVGIPTIKD